MSHTEYMRSWRAKNRDANRAYMKAYNAAYKRKHRAALKELNRKWAESPAGRASIKANGARMREKYPAKVKARTILNAAVRRGEIDRLPCEVCGDAKTQGHHDDYSQPLKVRWLCRPHHEEADRK